MPTPKVFISHAHEDKGVARELRTHLEDCGVPVWIDTQELRGGDRLHPEIDKAIRDARHTVVLIGPETHNSAWVQDEVAAARETADTDAGYRVAPLLLPGVADTALRLWFGPKAVPLAVRLDDHHAGAVEEALPELLAALGERLPSASRRAASVDESPVEELLLSLTAPTLRHEEGVRVLSAQARLVYCPGDPAQTEAESALYTFTAPIGPIELDDLRWYVEDYAIWPHGVFAERAARIVEDLPGWGRKLYNAVLAHESTRKPMAAWTEAAKRGDGRFSVKVDAGEDAEAAAAMLGLPWEILRNDDGYLAAGQASVHIRRRLPSNVARAPVVVAPPVRVLLVSPRPEEKGTAYIDHRVSARALVHAAEVLGGFLELTVLAPATFAALTRELSRTQYDVVHFDGHGIYDRHHGLGALCFEHPDDTQKLAQRRSELVHANKLAEIVSGARIPLVFLEACQGARADEDPTSSVAAALLAQGVSAVAAMNHSVLVETVQRFVTEFYRELAAGARVGSAMLAAQQALYADAHRGAAPGTADLVLQDWFVPVLYQERHDIRLFTRIPSDDVQATRRQIEARHFGCLPDPPKHEFVGRSRDLLALERILFDRGAQWAVVRGTGGVGKTALAVELARWLVRARRMQRAAFVCVEHLANVRAVVDVLGKQLLPEGDAWSVAECESYDIAIQHIERALRERPAVLVLDNMESVLPAPSGRLITGFPCDELLELCQRLVQAAPCTRLLFTSRELLPAPFDDPTTQLSLGNLSVRDAEALVEHVLKTNNWEPADDAETDADIRNLVEAVHCHARALVLLAREIATRGVRTTTADLAALMAGLERKNPGGRENSLYASLELSLRRLPDEVREKVDALAPFHSQAHVFVWDMLVEVGAERVKELAGALMAVGLAENAGDGHLTLDPGLTPYLRARIDETELAALTDRWADAVLQLVGFLYQQLSKDAHLAARLTLLELPNLMALLDWLPLHRDPAAVSQWAGRIEQLLANLGRPAALARAVAVREAAADHLEEWNDARCEADMATNQGMLRKGDLSGALGDVKRILGLCLSQPTHPFNVARAYFRLGRVLRMGGAAGAALEPLTEAQRRFGAIPDNASAARMASACLTEQGNCLMALGRLDEAAAAYEERIRRGEKHGDTRGVATGKSQLGTVRMYQRRYADAQSAHEESRDIFTRLGEPASIATAWHQIGRVHEEAGQHERAERAYRQALAMRVQHGLRGDEAATLNQLGNLCDAMGRTEEAVTFLRQAAGICVELGDGIHEGVCRSNLAIGLIKLRRYAEARIELHRAIECKQPYGHAAKPWTTWDILHDLELAEVDANAASAARAEAIRLFLAYRRDGGENHTTFVELCAAVPAALAGDQSGQLKPLLGRLASHPQATAALKVGFGKLDAILQGNRDPALADDPALHYSDAVELRLLLEQLGVTFPDEDAGNA